MKNSKDKPTPVFRRYFSWLVLRLVLFCTSIWLLVRHPEQLDFTEQFGLQGGLSFVNLVFCLIVIDLFTKLLPHASIAMGSRKQYGEYHVPTPRLFGGGVKELMDTAAQLIANAPATLRQKVQSTVEETITSARETAQGVKDASRQIAYSVDVLGVLPWSEEDLTASEILRSDIRRRRQHEIVPVLIFWVIFNALIWLLLDRFGIFNERTALVWTLFYFLFDMICVVLWCPLQLVLMRNRCCTTCQIFNWDGIMTTTPLIPFIGWFPSILVALSLAVLARWELAFMRHPERFDDRTNASLQCANCKDKLCHLRKPLRPRHPSSGQRSVTTTQETTPGNAAVDL